MRICEEHLDSRYDIEIVDLLENPQLAAGDEIVAIPTLVRRLPRRCARSSVTCLIPTGCSSDSSSAPRLTMSVEQRADARAVPQPSPTLEEGPTS